MIWPIYYEVMGKASAQIMSRNIPDHSALVTGKYLILICISGTERFKTSQKRKEKDHV